MHATAAQASPTINVSSPPAGQPLYDLRPTITVAYTSDDPAAPLNLATLRVTVNGFDWTARFTAGPDSATYAVTVDDELIAGALTIAASISDTAGASASTAAAYDVFPKLSALAPSTAEAGDMISLMASGLDPVAGRNKALLTPNGLTAALSDVDRSIDTGRFTLPAGTTTGDVGLEVNGKVARERIRLSVPSVVPNCGGIRSLFATADGGWLVAYGADFSKPVDPQCPPAQIVDFLKWRFVKVTAADDVVPLSLPPGNGLGNGVRIIPNKRRSDAAILKRNLSLPVVVRYKDVDTFLPGWVYAADFDRDGNLFVVFYNSGFRIYRVSKEALAQGGDVTLEPIAQLPVQIGGLQAYGFAVSCDGFAYVVVNQELNVYPWVQPRIFKVDLAARAVVGDRLLRVGEELENLALSCHTNELWSARFLNVQENTSAAIARTEVTSNGFGISEDVFVTPAAAFPIGVAVGVGGTVYFQTGTNAILAKRGAIAACPVPSGALPVCETPEEAIVILPSTTRWKPQRDTARDPDGKALNPIKIEFISPSPLKTATVTITGPSAVGSIRATFDPANPPNPYVITWAGFATDASGNASYLDRGDYKIAIEGVKEDDTTVKSAENDRNATVSLVEVTKVELCYADDSDDCMLLSDNNPAVGTLPGQDPPQDRPAEGKRLFAEAATPNGLANNRVKVRAITEPLIPTDSLRPATDLAVSVHFKSFDVDDPAPYVPDLDGDLQGKVPSDNRGSPTQGVLEQPVVNVAAGQAKAKTFLETSLQPGDNYRVAASTSREWLQGLQAIQPSPTGEMGVTVDERQTNVSEMLTVWRTLHVEIDSMRAPGDGASDPNYKERNFVHGRIVAIGDVRAYQSSGRKPTKLTLVPSATIPPLGLSDRSNDLSGPTPGCGRFDHGTIRIGVDAQAAVVVDLDGNGSDFVQKRGADPCPGDRKGGMNIPFRLVDPSGANAVTGNILEWDSQTKEFVLSSAVGRPTYDGGKLTVGGVTWTVQSARGPRTTVVEEQALPFDLLDDDEAVAPFKFSTSLLQAADVPGTNIFAQAYVRPRYDVPDVKQAPFNRNVSYPPGPDGTPDTQEIIDQLAKGRDSSISTAGFWTVYVQGAFQSDEILDRDPNAESASDAGVTLGDSDRFGTLMFMETIGDSTLRGDAGIERCSSGTLVHELGHQFGLEHEEDGIMTPGCLYAPRYFTASDLDKIRMKGATR